MPKEISKENLDMFIQIFKMSHSDELKKHGKEHVRRLIGEKLIAMGYSAQATSAVMKALYPFEKEERYITDEHRPAPMTIEEYNDSLGHYDTKIKSSLRENTISEDQFRRSCYRTLPKVGKGTGKAWKSKTVNKDSSVYNLSDPKVFTGTSEELAERAIKKWDSVIAEDNFLPGHIQSRAQWTASVSEITKTGKAKFTYWTIHAAFNGVTNQPLTYWIKIDLPPVVEYKVVKKNGYEIQKVNREEVIELILMRLTKDKGKTKNRQAGEFGIKFHHRDKLK